MKRTQLAVKVAHEVIAHAMDFPAEDVRDVLEDLALEGNRYSRYMKQAQAVLDSDEGDELFCKFDKEIDQLVAQARKAALASLNKK